MSATGQKTQCALCGRCLTSRGMNRHLRSCLEKNGSRIADQDAKAPGILHLKVHGGHRGSPYWLHLAADLNTTLRKLDSFLRDIWLECCGHRSAFFEQSPYASREIGMSRHIGRVLGPEGSVSYIYDFGFETQLILDGLGTYPGRVKGRNKIALLARNPAPDIPCEACGREQAEYICQECLMEGSEGILCPACMQRHKCDEAFLLRVMNSPRAGVCAYGSEHV